MKTRGFLRAAGVGTVAAVVAVGLSGCSASLGGVRCDFTVNHPHESKGSPGWMEGKARLRCTGAIDSAEGVVKMQRYSQGKWRDVSGTWFSRTITPVKPNTTYTIMTADKLCSDGTYRVAAKGSGVLKGHRRASIAWQYGGAAKITCK
jgi:hypothetical protein